MNILAIDTSNKLMGVAILKNEVIIGEIVTNIKRGQSERLMPAITKLMEDVHLVPSQLDQIIVAQGPGSYTGVRIGVTTAKTLAWALKIPVIAVSSIEALAFQGRFFHSIICPFFDARRSNIYANLYKWEDNKIIPLQSEMNLAMDDLLEQLAKSKEEVLFLSPDIHLYKERIVEYLGDLAIIPEGSYHFSRPSHLVLASYEEKISNPHGLAPNYLRLAEAEFNWQQAQKGKTTNE